jgi:hypothetical protein
MRKFFGATILAICVAVVSLTSVNFESSARLSSSDPRAALQMQIVRTEAHQELEAALNKPVIKLELSSACADDYLEYGPGDGTGSGPGSCTVSRTTMGCWNVFCIQCPGDARPSCQPVSWIQGCYSI